MSLVEKSARPRRLSPSDVLKDISNPGKLEHAIDWCIAGIREETGAAAVSVRGVASRAIDSACHGQCAAGAGGERDASQSVQTLPLLFRGTERGSVVLVSTARKPRVQQSERLRTWLGLLAVLLEAALADEPDCMGCVPEAVFLKRLDEQWLWCREHDKPLSVVSLARPETVGQADRADPSLSPLVELGGRLKDRLRFHDTVGAKGNLLRCLLPNTDGVAAEIAMARIRREAEALAGASGGETWWFAARVTFPDDAETVEQLWTIMQERLNLAAATAAAVSIKG
jgi:hypothetical protein